MWSNHSWTFDSLSFPLSPHLQNLIQGIPVAHIAHLPDTYLWPYNKGTCFVKSASHFLYNQHQVPWNTTLWNWLWTLPCPKKIQLFLWKAMRNRLPTKTFLSHGRQHVDSQCSRCNSPETTLHTLQDYPWAREVWSQSPRILPLSFFHMHYKTGSDIMQRWIKLYFPISSCGESTSLSLARNFGLPEMKESSRTTLDPSIVSYTPWCKQLQNFISLLAPPVDPQAAFLNLLDGMPPLSLS